MAVVSAYLTPHPPLIFPEIGRGEELKIQATIDACRRVGAEIAAGAPDTVVIASPHSVLYASYFHIAPGRAGSGDMARFHAANVKLETAYDTEFVEALCGRADDIGFPAGTGGEQSAALDHAVMIPLRFIFDGYAAAGKKPDFKTVRLSVSGLSLQNHAQYGRMIAETAAALGKKTIFIASGDLSHRLKPDGPYGFAAEGPQFDAAITDSIRRGAPGETLALDRSLCEKAAECGLRPLAIMAGIFDGAPAAGELYSYEGPFGVGYAVGKIGAA
ncbi:MAG: hypothetical protein LBG74_07720 [Spirochaetaceae bacterium]|jgi:aromatic ring-opening dioxygenase LigB subunit|nr:hypothetical protein [Spirochaetaceae bacterium]